MPRIRIGDLLLNARLIDEMQLQAALAHQKRWGGKLGDILIELGFVDEMMIYKALEKQLGLKLVPLPSLQPSPELLASLTHEQCVRHGVFPVRLKDRDLYVATSDPGDVDALDELAFVTGFRVRPMLAPSREIEWAIGRYYRGDPSPCPPPRTRRSVPSDEGLEVIHARGGAVQLQPTSATVGAPRGGGGPEGPVRVGPSPEDEALRRAEATLRETTHLIRLVVETCIRRGIFTREEYLEKMRRQG